MMFISNVNYFPNGTINILKQDRISKFINSVKIIPHDFGHQSTSCDISTNGYRLMGDFEIIYFVGGKSYVNVGNKKYICQKGDFVFIPPFVKNNIETSTKNPHNNYWIHFDIVPLSMSVKFSNIFSESENYLIHINNDILLTDIYKMIEDEYIANKKGFSVVLKASILLILMEVFNNIEIEKSIFLPDLNPSKHLLSEKIIKHISENIYRINSVSDLCKKFNISKTHINNIFKTNIGTSPGKLIQLQKLKKAETLILTTSLTIEEVSYKLSYSSPAYFNNLFKKHYGISPGKYRNSFV